MTTTTESRALKLVVEPFEYEHAIRATEACNLSGIVKHLAKTLDAIWDEARANGLGTDYVNEHPICVLYASQIANLTHFCRLGDINEFEKAYEICQRRASATTLDELNESERTLWEKAQTR